LASALEDGFNFAPGITIYRHALVTPACAGARFLVGPQQGLRLIRSR